jgi:hypothetical protein
MIYHPQRKTYYFAASNETQMKDWMREISEQKSQIQDDVADDYSSSSDEEVSCFKLMKRKKKKLLIDSNDEDLSMNAMKDEFNSKLVIVSKRDQATQTESVDDTNRINCKIQCEACPHKNNQSTIIVNGHINLNMRIDPEKMLKVRVNDQFPVTDIESCQLSVEKPKSFYSERIVKEKLVRLCENMSKQLNMELNVDSVSIGECSHHTKITDSSAKNVFINNGANHNTNIFISNINGCDETLNNFLKNVLKIDESKV